MITRLRTVVPLLLVSVVVCTVSVGLAHGIWLSNLHNGLLALAFSFVGGYVLVQRPGHREGVLFVATGLVEAVMFTGRQIGHSPISEADRWWGWLGVWPVAIALALTTLSVLCFPNGRLPSPGWRWVAAVVVAIAVVCSGISALWPVEYDATGIVTPHPINPAGHAGAARVWGAIAHPAYAGFRGVKPSGYRRMTQVVGPGRDGRLLGLLSEHSPSGAGPGSGPGEFCEAPGCWV